MSSYQTNPFGIPTDSLDFPKYTTPSIGIQSVLFNHLQTIFSYKTFSEPDLLDAGLKKWVAKNEKEVYFQELQIRAGAGSLPLGFQATSGNSTPVGIVTPGYGLKYLFSTLRKNAATNDTFKLALQVAALDYSNDVIKTDYVTPLRIAEALNFPVITPINHNEVKHTAAFSLFLSQYGSAIHLFDGANYAKTLVSSKDEQSFTAIPPVSTIANAQKTDLDHFLSAFNDSSAVKIHNFKYFGSENAKTVFVTYGSLESELFANYAENAEIGHIAIRIPFPFATDKFVALLPKHVENVVVIGQTLTSSSKSDLQKTVVSALKQFEKSNIQVSEFVYTPDFIWSPNAVAQIVENHVPTVASNSAATKDSSFVVWADDHNGENLDLSSKLIHALSLVDGQKISSRTKYDNVANAGTFQAQFIAFDDKVQKIVSNIDSADVTFVANSNILNEFDVTNTTKEHGTVIVVLDKKSIKDHDLNVLATYTEHLKLSSQFLANLVKKDLKLVFIDKELVGDREETKTHTLSFVSQAVFWKYSIGADVAESVRRIWSSAGPDIELLASVISDSVTDAIANGVKEIAAEQYTALFKDLTNEKEGEEKDEKPAALKTFVEENSFTANPRSVPSTEEKVSVVSSFEIAKQLTFSEVYGVKNDLRPHLPVKNFVVKVAKNKRVTPESYSRNIFEIEFDTTGTGLKYEIGEALGVHAKNNTALVEEFLAKYGLNGNDVIAVANREDASILEYRTVFQAFTENLDVFGKPGKKFYEALIEHATNDDEKKQLTDLVSAAGAAELKRFQEEEYYTYADILELFPSCKPKLEDLVKIIAPLKRREYSIASSQKVHPNAVHLLVVVVDWVDKKGNVRYGQASKYLSDLPVGAELVVSVKPSVMRLPPRPEQPIIMSGLGTGLAPFKAIIEEKVWQKEQGYEIGDIFLFLGSRHKREEYLYGELWEAYKDAGVLTHIGAAFSRDQPHKIYIQDKINEALDMLSDAMCKQEGSFYLCGPTWPVPNITEALQNILAKDAAEKGVKIDLNQATENLKETGRYILEVY
ncbi:hypothetical protein ACO0QE_001524 [Hanseniaspora vineae]